MQELTRKNKHFDIVGVSISYDNVPTTDNTDLS
jgi:hypothetical protein